MPFDERVGTAEKSPLLEWRRTEVSGRVASYGVGGNGPADRLPPRLGPVGPHLQGRAEATPRAGLPGLGAGPPGFDGSSALASGAGDLADYARWVDEFLDAVGVTEPVVMMGHSFGGGVAIQTAHD